MSSGCGSVLLSQFRTMYLSSPSTRLDRVLPKRWTTGWTTCSFGCFGFSTFDPAGYSAHFISARRPVPSFEHTRRAVLCCDQDGDDRRSGALFGGIHVQETSARHQ
jgi:hypothetical protein